MFNGIEVSHPVYATLFCDLIVTMASSGFDVLVFPFIQVIRGRFLKNGVEA
jgi:hypothetical protein